MLSDSLDHLWKQSKSIFSHKLLWRHDFKEETGKTKDLLFCVLHTIKNLHKPHKQHRLSTVTLQNHVWSIFIICQEWSLTIKHTFFKVVDEGLLDSVFLWVQCRDYIMEINYIMANERNHFYCTICETAHNTENWKYKLPFLCWIPLSSFTNPRAIYLLNRFVLQQLWASIGSAEA